jgi:hypothetical protein
VRSRAEHEKGHHHFSELPIANEKAGGTADLPHGPQADESDSEQIDDNNNPVNEFKT